MNIELVKLLRPHQWLKNLFVFVPVFFGGSLFNLQAFLGGLVAFAAFCMVSSSIYCFNDIIDADDDRRHPEKCKRPVASGTVSKSKAYVLMGVCLVFALAFMLLPHLFNAQCSIFNFQFLKVGAVLAFYFLLNLAYCLWLKQFSVLDVVLIAFGFVLRLFAGGFATGIPLSHWIVMMTFLLTLFLSFAKRRDDVVRMELTGEAPRKNTGRYNLTFINQAVTITAAVTLVCYIMYTVSPDVVERTRSPYLYLTSVFVLVGLLRYLQITVVELRSGDPTKVMLRDHFMQTVVVLWLLSYTFIIYIM